MWYVHQPMLIRLICDDENRRFPLGKLNIPTEITLNAKYLS